MVVLFENEVFLSLTDDISDSLERRKSKLLLKIEERNFRHSKELVFNCVSDDDIRFVYRVSLSKGDYESVKREQQLDIDFDTFPKKIIDFLNSYEDNSEAKLRGVFNSDKSVLNFELIGKIGFKWVTILSLPLQLLSEANLIEHLVEQVTKLKKTVNDLHIMHETLSAERQEMERLELYISDLKESHARELEDLIAKKNQECAHESSVFDNLRRDVDELESDKQMLGQEVIILKEELIDLRERLTDLTESKSNLEEDVKMLNQSLAAAEERVQANAMHLDHLEVELSAKEEEVRDLDEKLNHMSKECDYWKKEQEKGIVIIRKMYEETEKLQAENENNLSFTKKEAARANLLASDYLKKIQSCNGANNHLSAENAKLLKEVDEVKKCASEWEAKCNIKERILCELVKKAHNVARNSGGVQEPSSTGSHPRILGWPTMYGNISTPLRNMTISSPTENATQTPVVIPPTTLQNKDSPNKS